MSNFSILAIMSFIAAALIVGFQALATLMATGKDYMGMTLYKILEGGITKWIETISFDFIKNSLLFVMNKPLYLVLIAFGIIMFAFDKLFIRD